MPENAYGSIEKIEADLWEAADQLRANSTKRRIYESRTRNSAPSATMMVRICD